MVEPETNPTPLSRGRSKISSSHLVETSSSFAAVWRPDSIDHYLQYNAGKFVDRFDCNSYLTLLEAMDAFDLKADGKDLVEVFTAIGARVLVVAVDSDVLFTPPQQRELYEALTEAGVDAAFVEHHSDYGHDAFLVEIDEFGRYIRDSSSPRSRRNK